MTWDEAMERYGHDAPDLRYGCELVDCTDIAATVDFRVFRETADAGKKVRGINAPRRRELLQPQADRRADRVCQAVRSEGAGLVPRRAGREADVAECVIGLAIRRTGDPVRPVDLREPGKATPAFSMSSSLMSYAVTA